MSALKSSQKFPLTALVAASGVVVIAVGVLSITSGVDFGLFFGNVHPILAVMAICSVGIYVLYLLNRRFSFSIYNSKSFRQGLPVAVAVAVPFMIAVTIADVVFRFPVDVNVPPPAAFIFYPAIGYVTQFALHIVPFAILLFASSLLSPTNHPNRRIWITIALVSTIEAAFQAASSVGSGGSLGITTFTAISLFFFGLVELYLFRRFDYATMYVFRFFYYCYWHLAWGSLRLNLLF